MKLQKGKKNKGKTDGEKTHKHEEKTETMKGKRNKKHGKNINT